MGDRQPESVYFVTTNAVNAVELWRPTSTTQPILARADHQALLNGSEGQQMSANITSIRKAEMTLLEDVGNNADLGKVWQYDRPPTCSTHRRRRPSAGLSGGANLLTQDEEASAVVDTPSILGNAGENVDLVDTQRISPPGFLPTRSREDSCRSSGSTWCRLPVRRRRPLEAKRAAAMGDKQVPVRSGPSAESSLSADR